MTHQNEAISLWAKIKNYFCAHEFAGKDMKPRDENGNVHWPCRKCGKVFSASYGLEILQQGRCIGEWR